jgi:hypothetical protein
MLGLSKYCWLVSTLVKLLSMPQTGSIMPLCRLTIGIAWRSYLLKSTLRLIVQLLLVSKVLSIW